MIQTKTEIQQQLNEARELPLLVENLKECIEHCKTWKSINARFTQYITEKHPNYYAVLTKDTYKTNLFVKDKEGEARLDITIFTSFDQSIKWQDFIDYINKLKLFENIQHYEKMLERFDDNLKTMDKLIEHIDEVDVETGIGLSSVKLVLERMKREATRDQN